MERGPVAKHGSWKDLRDGLRPLPREQYSPPNARGKIVPGRGDRQSLDSMGFLQERRRLGRIPPDLATRSSSSSRRFHRFRRHGTRERDTTLPDVYPRGGRSLATKHVARRFTILGRNTDGRDSFPDPCCRPAKTRGRSLGVRRLADDTTRSRIPCPKRPSHTAGQVGRGWRIFSIYSRGRDRGIARGLGFFRKEKGICSCLVTQGGKGNQERSQLTLDLSYRNETREA